YFRSTPKGLAAAEDRHRILEQVFAGEAASEAEISSSGPVLPSPQRPARKWLLPSVVTALVTAAVVVALVVSSRPTTVHLASSPPTHSQRPNPQIATCTRAVIAEL